MEDELANAAPVETELDRVESWRLRELLNAGYSVADAEAIAAQIYEIDLHFAVKLVAGGCPPALAAQILL